MKEGFGGAGARGTSEFGGVLAFCTPPPAIPAALSAEGQMEHPLEGHRERWELLESSTELVLKHQKHFPSHLQGCEAGSRP